MTFRRTNNKHEGWRVLVQENHVLLCELPAAALANENAFRDYVTRGVHRDITLTPSVFDLSAKARAGLFEFMHAKACFDMDVTGFDDFNEAFRRDHAQQRI